MPALHSTFLIFPSKMLNRAAKRLAQNSEMTFTAWEVLRDRSGNAQGDRLQCQSVHCVCSETAFEMRP